MASVHCAEVWDQNPVDTKTGHTQRRKFLLCGKLMFKLMLKRKGFNKDALKSDRLPYILLHANQLSVVITIVWFLSVSSCNLFHTHKKNCATLLLYMTWQLNDHCDSMCVCMSFIWPWPWSKTPSWRFTPSQLFYFGWNITVYTIMII